MTDQEFKALQEFEALVGRVQRGLLVYATPDQIRTQLRSEGIPEDKINAALVRGQRLADVRLEETIKT